MRHVTAVEIDCYYNQTKAAMTKFEFDGYNNKFDVNHKKNMKVIVTVSFSKYTYMKFAN